MPARGAWVREKKSPKPTREVDPAVALFPALRYFGCRPNLPEPRRERNHSQSMEMDEIEIVAPPTPHHHHQQHQQQPRHEQHYGQRHAAQERTPLQEARRRLACQNSNTGFSGRSMARENPRKTNSAAQLDSMGREMRPRASAASLPRDPYSRAIAVHRDAITPLAM